MLTNASTGLLIVGAMSSVSTAREALHVSAGPALVAKTVNEQVGLFDIYLMIGRVLFFSLTVN